MRIELIESLAAFQTLRGAWHEVYANDPEGQFFLSWEWLQPALEANPGQWLILAARNSDGRYVGFLPLRRTTVWSEDHKQLRNELHFAGRFLWSDYGGLLCLPGHEKAVVPALAEYVKSLHWSHFYLKGFRVSEQRYALFMEPFSDPRLKLKSLTHIINDGKVDNLICPYVDLPDSFETYLNEKLSRKMRQEVRRYLRRIESSPEYGITFTSPATHARDLDALQTLWIAKWSESKGGKTTAQALRWRTIVQHALTSGLAQISVFWHRDKPVAVQASFVDRTKSRMLFFIGARDNAFDEVPAGVILNASNIRWAIEQGLRTYDFLRGNEPYKYSFGAQDVHIKYPLIRTRSGTNLNGQLDPQCIGEALNIANKFARNNHAEDATAACQQILAMFPPQEAARHLLRSLNAMNAMNARA